MQRRRAFQIIRTTFAFTSWVRGIAHQRAWCSIIRAPCSLFSPFSCSLSSSSSKSSLFSPFSCSLSFSSSKSSLFPVLSILLFSLSSSSLLPFSVLSLPPLFSHSPCSLFSPFSCKSKGGGRERTRERREQGTVRVGEERRTRENKRMERTGNRELLEEEEEREQENGENREQ